MKKKLKDLTREDICNTCSTYCNNFTTECPKSCPFYMEIPMTYKYNGRINKTNCKTSYNYIKKHSEEEIEI